MSLTWGNVPGPLPLYRTTSDGKLGGGLGTRLEQHCYMYLGAQAAVSEWISARNQTTEKSWFKVWFVVTVVNKESSYVTEQVIVPSLPGFCEGKVSSK